MNASVQKFLGIEVLAIIMMIRVPHPKMDRRGIAVTSQPSHVRAVSLVLALSVFTGGRLLLEYSQRLPQRAPLTEQPSEPTQENALPPESTVSPPPKVARPISPAPPKNLIATFKSEQGGRVSYREQPCANGAKTLAVTAEMEIQTPNPTNPNTNSITSSLWSWVDIRAVPTI